jgi:hypothetical protein
MKHQSGSLSLGAKNLPGSSENTWRIVGRFDALGRLVMRNDIRWIAGYEGLYQITDDGRVSRGGQFLNPVHHNKGYWRIGLCKNGIKTWYLLHVLVARTFLGVKPTGFETNHKNGDKHDNRIENLEYVTHAENQQHAGREGLLCQGEQHRWTRVPWTIVVKIRELGFDGLSPNEIEVACGVSHKYVRRILSGKRRRNG